MPKVYNQKTIDMLQKAIDRDEATFERQEYGFVTKLYMAGVRIELLTNSDGRREGIMNITNYNTNNDYMVVWRTFAPGYFMTRDFRKDVRDADGNCPYFIVRTKLHDVPVRCIVRELFEDNAKLRQQYTDQKKDGRLYTVIKICTDLDPEDDTWLTGKDKVGDIAHAAYIDEIVGIDTSTRHQRPAEYNGEESYTQYTSLESEMVTTFF